jgi:hypothetical protein
MKIIPIIVFFLATFSFVSGQGSFDSFEDNPYGEDRLDVAWYPNPVKVGDRITVSLDMKIETEMETEMVDALGRKVMELKAVYPQGQSLLHIGTSDLESGLYFIRLSTDRTTETEKIIIQ